MGGQKNLYLFRYKGKNNAALTADARAREENRSGTAPKTLNLFLVDSEKRTISLEQFTQGILYADFIENMIKRNNPAEMNILDVYADRVGELLCIMHEKNSIHGNLSTRNVLLVEKVAANTQSSRKWLNHANIDLVISDFGNSCANASPEAKGQDLFILEISISELHINHPDLFGKIFESYKSHSRNNITEIVSKYEEIKMTLM